MNSRRNLILWVSLGLNIAFMSFVAVRWLKPKERGAGPPPGLFHVRQVLNGAAPPALDEQLKQARQELRPQRRVLRQARRRVRRALEAEIYKPAELATALAELRNETLVLQEQSHQSLVSVLGSLDVEQRRRVAAANWQRRRKKPRR